MGTAIEMERYTSWRRGYAWNRDPSRLTYRLWGGPEGQTRYEVRAAIDPARPLVATVESVAEVAPEARPDDGDWRPLGGTEYGLPEDGDPDRRPPRPGQRVRCTILSKHVGGDSTYRYRWEPIPA